MAFLERNANRGSISTGYDIDNSCKLESNNSERFLAADPFQDYDSARIFTRSLWVKRSEITNHQQFIADFSVNTNVTIVLEFDATDHLRYFVENSGTKINLKTNRLFRDISAWYHIFLAVDTTQGTAANRVKIYVNGVQETSFATEVYPAQNLDLPFQTRTYMFGYDGGNNGFCGYATEFHALDGIAAAPTAFGEFDAGSGIWKPIEYTGNYGTEGYYLNFSDSANMGKDHGPNAGGNAFADPSAVAAADQSTDTPTNNFCTLNPLGNFKYTTHGFTEGATTFGDNTGGGVGGALGTMAVTAGKWYWEMKLVQQVQHYIGISSVDDNDNVSSSSDPHQINSSFVFNISAARVEYINGGSVTAGSADAFADFHSTGAIMSIALNMDDNQISIYGNGSLQSGVANTSIYDASNKMVVPFHATINDTVQYNFGGYSAWTPSSAATDANGYGTFEYAPPSGYYALCTKNLAEYGG